MPSRRLSVLAATVAFALLLGACSDDDDAGGDGETTTTEAGADGADGGDDEAPVTATAEEYIAAVAASASAEELEVVGAERSQCIAVAYTNAVGAERLAEAGVTPEEFAADDFSVEDEGLVPDEAAQQQLATDFAACGSAQDLFVGLIGSATEFSAEQESCVREAVSEEAAVAYFVDGLLGQDPDPALVEAVQPCFPDAEG